MKRNVFIRKIVIIAAVCGIFFCFNSAIAATCREKYLDSLGACASECSTLGSDFQLDSNLGLCGSGEVCCHKTASTTDAASQLELQIPLFDYAKAANLPEYILKIYQYTMIVIVPLAIIMIIIGGIMWISAAGAKDKITGAKKYIINAFIGLGIALFSYVFLSFVGIETLTMPGLQKIEPEIGEMIVLSDGSVVSYTEYMSKLAPERQGSIAAYDAKGCPKGQTTFEVLFTNYYMPKYGEEYGKNDFFCNVGMQCTCPNGDARDMSRNCNYKKVYHPCKNFSASTPYCTASASGKPPVANKTVAADSSCFQLKSGCQFKIKGSENTYEIMDTGGWIHGQHMDLFVGFRENINNIAGVYTITLQNPGSCFK
jgi:3D (Asp-Asp-Asp) domain-containing protein